MIQVVLAGARAKAVEDDDAGGGDTPGAAQRRQGGHAHHGNCKAIDVANLTTAESRRTLVYVRALVAPSWNIKNLLSMIRQFVAMPLGEGYTAEEQLTGEAQHGGLPTAQLG